MRTPLMMFLTILALVGAPVRTLAAEKDLRTLSDAAGETEVSFCARPSPNDFGLPGHEFVAFSEQPTGKPRTFRAVGHTVAPTAGPVTSAFTYFSGGSVAGQQAEERYTHVKQACLTLKVDRAVYQSALVAARPTLTALGIPDAVAASAERYTLNGNDCIDFVMRVAQVIKPAGLTVPARGAIDTPMSYLQKLIAANP